MYNCKSLILAKTTCRIWRCHFASLSPKFLQSEVRNPDNHGDDARPVCCIKLTWKGYTCVSFLYFQQNKTPRGFGPASQRSFLRQSDLGAFCEPTRQNVQCTVLSLQQYFRLARRIFAQPLALLCICLKRRTGRRSLVRILGFHSVLNVNICGAKFGITSWHEILTSCFGNPSAECLAAGFRCVFVFQIHSIA